jgi:predicted phosphodiesterase
VRIGLASDTFGNLDLLERALGLFARAQVERVFFLGGRVSDVDAVLGRLAAGPGPLAAPRSIVRVASRSCPEYESGTVPRKQVDLADGLICCLVHDKAELSREDIANASVLFHGNTAEAALVQIGPRCFITPGHMRAAAPGGRPPSFAIADVTARQIVLTVFTGDCAELRQDRALVGSAAKISVR